MHAELVVPVGKNNRGDHDLVSGDTADRVAPGVYLGRDCFNDHAVTAVGWLHRLSPWTAEIARAGDLPLKLHTSGAAMEMVITGREMRGLAGGIAFSADGCIRSRLLQEKA